MSSNNNLERCDIGIKFDQPYHKQSYCKKMDIISINSSQQYEREVVKWRTGIETSNATSYLHQKEVFLKRFAANEKNCCDPFSHHGNSAASRKRKGIIQS